MGNFRNLYLLVLVWLVIARGEIIVVVVAVVRFVVQDVLFEILEDGLRREEYNQGWLGVRF